MIFEINDGHGRITITDDICECLNFDGVPLNMFFWVHEEEEIYMYYYQLPFQSNYFKTIKNCLSSITIEESDTTLQVKNKLSNLFYLFPNGRYNLEIIRDLPKTKSYTGINQRISTSPTYQLAISESNDIERIKDFYYEDFYFGWGDMSFTTRLVATIPESKIEATEVRKIVLENITEKITHDVILYHSLSQSEINGKVDYYFDGFHTLTDEFEYHIIYGHQVLKAYEHLKKVPNFIVLTKIEERHIPVKTNLEYLLRFMKDESIKLLLLNFFDRGSYSPELTPYLKELNQNMKTINQDYEKDRMLNAKRLRKLQEKHKTQITRGNDFNKPQWAILGFLILLILLLTISAVIASFM